MKKPKTKKEMIEYLSDHFRYDTMSSWNRATSYARNVKISHLDIPQELMDRAYEMLQLDEAYYDINELIGAFEEKYDHEWQAGFNGRSGGYIVLYEGGYKTRRYFSAFSSDDPDDKRDYSDYYGRWYSHAEAKKMGTAYLTYKQKFTMPGKGLDMGEDFKEWDMEELRERVDIVWDFDKLCEDCVQAFINFVKDYTVVEEEIMVPKTIKTAVPVA